MHLLLSHKLLLVQELSGRSQYLTIAKNNIFATGSVMTVSSQTEKSL